MLLVIRQYIYANARSKKPQSFNWLIWIFFWCQVVDFADSYVTQNVYIINNTTQMWSHMKTSQYSFAKYFLAYSNNGAPNSSNLNTQILKKRKLMKISITRKQFLDFWLKIQIKSVIEYAFFAAALSVCKLRNHYYLSSSTDSMIIIIIWYS